jgi:hypothetical protein
VEIAGKKFRAITNINDRLSSSDHAPHIAEKVIGIQFDPANTTLGQMSRLIDQFSLADRFGPTDMLSSLATISGLSEQAEQTLSSTLVGSFGLLNSVAESMTGSTELASKMLGVVEAPYVNWEIPITVAEAMELWHMEGTAALAAPLLNAQDTYASILESLPVPDLSIGYGVIADQTRLLSSTMAAVMNVPDYDSLLASLTLGEVEDPELLSIPAELSVISSTLAGVFQESLASLQSPEFPSPNSELFDHLYFSTLPVSHFAQASRYITVNIDEPTDEDLESQSPTVTEVGIEDLDPLLRRLNPGFVNKRQGSWLALNSSNPDRLAHAASSQRNLLVQVLCELVPDETITEEDRPGSKIKARVKKIMGGSKSDTAHTTAVADAVFAGYSVFCKFDHTIQVNERSLRGQMLASEALMYMILCRLEEE